MKVFELEVSNFRGIRNVLLKPEGKNFLIWGHNGSGKSTVVDSLDFLFTGKISRMQGKGTAGITIKEHGVHIKGKPADTSVRAIITLPGFEGKISLFRTMKKSTKLECEPEEARPFLEPVIRAATHGQNVLTRREILKYVTSEPSTRAAQVQELLSLDQLEKTRKSLTKAAKDLKKEVSNTEGFLKTREEELIRTLGLSAFSITKVLGAINKLRTDLGSTPLEVLSGICEGVQQPSSSAGPSRGLLSLAEDLEDADTFFENPTFMAINSQIHGVVQRLTEDAELKVMVKRMGLLGQAVSLIAEDGACPLCNASHAPGELSTRLKGELVKAKKAKKLLAQLSELTKDACNQIRQLRLRIERLIEDAESEECATDLETLSEWIKTLEMLEEATSKPISSGLNALVPENGSFDTWAPSKIIELIKELASEVQNRIGSSVSTDESSSKIQAWTILNRAQDQIEGWFSTKKQHDKFVIAEARAEIVRNAFDESRDLALTRLFQVVAIRFAELYRSLHEGDEDSFDAVLEPQGAGLSFEVDFHSTGRHPPHALHSEGHQDSMGLCLYLALGEQLSTGVELIVLDDVMMSVDADHRKQLSLMIKNQFPGKQFLITTHDRAWVHQLRSYGVFDRNNIIEFTNWTLERGPRVSAERDIWEKIETFLEEGDTERAAHLLRRASEEHFATICDKLGANVRFRLDGRQSLGDYYLGLSNRYKSLLKLGKVSANSWNDRDNVTELTKMDDEFKRVVQRVKAEEWAVNAQIHYNNWANFSANDLRDVVDAYHEFWSLFECHRCGSLVMVTYNGMTEAGMRCSCGAINVNLLKK